MKTPIKIILFLLYIMVLGMAGGCEKNNNDTPKPDDNDTLNLENKNLAIFYTICDNLNGKDHGMVIIDADSMKILEVLKSDKFMSSIELSSDYSTWYIISSDYDLSDVHLLKAIDSETGDVVKKVEVNNPKMALSKESGVFVVYGDSHKGLQFIDKNTFEIIHEEDTYEIYQGDTLYANVKVAALSPDDKLYYGWHNKIFEYDINEYTITQEFPIQGETSYSLNISDIKFSPDGNFLYATVTYIGQGLFFSIKIANGTYNYYHAGYDSQIAVSSDRKYVYVTDPAGLPNPYEDYPEPTNKVFRYDVKEGKMDAFLEGAEELELTKNGALLTSYAHVSPNNKYLYLVLWSRKHTIEGDPVDIVKINIETKEIVDYLELPENWKGWMISDTKIAKFKTR